jgi:isopenicillin-N N-acyltransferase like protein
MIKLSVLILSILSYTAYAQQDIREISLSGSGYELGFQHGTLLKKEIGELVEKMKQSTFISKEEAEQVLADFNSYANFDESIKKYTPDLYEEIRGIAEGSGQEFRDVMLLNLLDEFWAYTFYKISKEEHHCSGMGLPSINGSTSYLAQNMDLPTYTAGYQILFRISRTKERPEQLILTYPGLIGLNGMNETGIGVCVNTLLELKASSNGLPVAFIVRRIINSTDQEDLLHFIQTVSHASGQNYILGIRGDVYDFEASANKVVRFDPGNKNGAVYHTNHSIVNDDIWPWIKELTQQNLGQNPMNINSIARLATVQNRVAQNDMINDSLIKETLRSKEDANSPICLSSAGKGAFTFASVIMTMTGVPYIQITSGPPDESEYKTVYFSKK